LYQIVPQRAQVLKNKGVKVLLVAVPSRDDNPGGVSPKVNYFNGIVDPSLRPNGDSKIISTCKPGDMNCQCAYFPIQRKPNKIFCSSMQTPPFPIQSVGLFFNGTWETIVNDTASSASCGTVISDQTDSPSTSAPSQHPSVPAPTRQPTLKPIAQVRCHFRRAPPKLTRCLWDPQPTRQPTAKVCGARRRSPRAD
jgi:hypothetical protein